MTLLGARNYGRRWMCWRRAWLLCCLVLRDSWVALLMVPGAWSVRCAYWLSFVLIVGNPRLLCSLAVPGFRWFSLAVPGFSGFFFVTPRKLPALACRCIHERLVTAASGNPTTTELELQMPLEYVTETTGKARPAIIARQGCLGYLHVDHPRCGCTR